MKNLILGSSGLVGSAIKRKIPDALSPTSKELNLLDKSKVDSYFKYFKPEKVYLAAAKVGGIYANSTYPADFIYTNIQIQTNVIHACYENNCKLLFLGSSCIYPKNCPQPIKEEYLLSGYLEPTNQPYAIAKIAGIEMCKAFNKQHGCNFISVMPTNVYGINDNYDLNNSHVLPALIHKIHLAKKEDKDLLLWGDGSARREFINSDDLADACIFLMEKYNSPDHINIGYGKDISIKELSYLISEVLEFKGQINFDNSNLNGTPVKLLDSSKLNSLGWNPKVKLRDGIKIAYESFKGKLNV
jgi:GDP-L-fucose synthase